MNYKIDVNDREWRRALEYLQENHGRMTRALVSRLAERAAGKIKELISGTGHFRTHPTGQLMQQLVWRVLSDDEAEISEDAVYGPIHEYGGDIYPVRKKFLAFQINGEWVFTRHVYIPPRPYFHPTLERYLESEEAKAECIDTIREFLDKAVEHGVGA